jgi:hypothetical protein
MPVRLIESLATTAPLTDLFPDQSILQAMFAFEVALARAESPVESQAAISGPSLSRWEEFRLHFATGFAHELERCDLRDVLLQVAIFAVVPAANTGFHHAAEVSARHRNDQSRISWVNGTNAKLLDTGWHMVVELSDHYFCAQVK